ncbi:hypothetical protein LR48_Vigan03g164700 [Vigna angularis]|uniref:Uncharacterized protein n=1 Tax=Phaseolus angularis TaxID=3914 RepID=A0A0L9U653_PHAAN|nr:hypothetical protein LR48_Vigan03g164700 [Vigna angularis]
MASSSGKRMKTMASKRKEKEPEQPHSSRFLSRKHEKHFKVVQDRRLLMERKVGMIPNFAPQFEEQLLGNDWGKLATYPTPANIAVVKEFYVNARKIGDYPAENYLGYHLISNTRDHLHSLLHLPPIITVSQTLYSSIYSTKPHSLIHSSTIIRIRPRSLPTPHGHRLIHPLEPPFQLTHKTNLHYTRPQPRTMTHFQHPNTSPYFAFTEPKRGSLFSKREKWRRWRRGWWWFWWRELSPARPRRVLVEATVAGYGRGDGELVVPSRRPWVSREGVSWGVGNEDEPPEPLGNSRLPCLNVRSSFQRRAFVLQSSFPTSVRYLSRRTLVIPTMSVRHSVFVPNVRSSSPYERSSFSALYNGKQWKHLYEEAERDKREALKRLREAQVQVEKAGHEMKEMAMSFEADMNRERWKLAEAEEEHRTLIKQMEEYIEEQEE